MRDSLQGATCDGGDCCFPGNELFVGMSGRTNKEGIEFLEGAFDGIEVVPVPVPSSGLHLKSIMSHIDERTLLIPDGQLGEQVFKAMNGEERGYTKILLPDISACNVVSVNGHVLVPPTTCEKSRRILEEEIQMRGMKIAYVDASEFSKRDGALTCKSILLNI